MNSSESSWDVVSSPVLDEMERIQACVEEVGHIHAGVNSYVVSVESDYKPFAIISHSFKELLSVFDPNTQREARERRFLVSQQFKGVRKAKAVLNEGLYVLRKKSIRVGELSRVVLSPNSSGASDLSDLSDISLNSLTNAQDKINKEMSDIQKTLSKVEGLITRIFASYS